MHLSTYNKSMSSIYHTSGWSTDFYMAPMEGKETPTNINMALYKK